MGSMTSPDHRFRPIVYDAKHCTMCGAERPAPQHFGDHAGSVVPVPGFTCGAGLTTKGRARP